MTAELQSKFGESFADWQQKVGVEREVKWSFLRPRTVQTGLRIDAVLAGLPLPEGFEPHEPYSHEQSLVYLDCDWRLAASEKSLTVVLNQGPTGHLAWIKTKQTISWQGLRRDALEIAERTEATALPLAMLERPVLPIRQLAKQFDNDVRWQPFATSHQLRWKMNVKAPCGTTLTVSWDECVLEGIGSDKREPVQFVEVETVQLTEAACQDLQRLADAVSGYLDLAPTTASKSQRAAALCGFNGCES